MPNQTFDEAGGVYAVADPAVFVDGDVIDSTTVDDPGAPDA